MKHSELVEVERDHPSLRTFADLLVERAVPMGLVAAHDSDRVLERHVLDSARAINCIPEGTRDVVDIGSGAGLPGIPIAILRPELRVTLLEPQWRRVGFLELAVAALGLRNVKVVRERAEGSRLRADVVFARALGAAATSWRLAEPLLLPGGALVYFAGRSWTAAAGAEMLRLGATAEVCVSGEGDVGPLVMMRRIVGFGA